MNCYHYPKFSKFNLVFFRLGGPGLGNLLFPMYRAFQAARKSNEIFVFPTFFQLKIGPILRREKDSRSYADLFQRRSISEIMLNFRFELNLNKSVREEELVGNSSKRSDASLILYEGMRNFFYDLDAELRNDFTQYLESRLNDMAKLEIKCKEICPDDVCVHIRGGDFSNKNSEIYSDKMNIRNSSEWYIQAIRYVKKIKPDTKFRIFSDEKYIPLEILNELSSYEVDESKNALHALILMSKHSTIISSRSTFSLWSAFLGCQKIIVSRYFNINAYLPSVHSEIVVI